MSPERKILLVQGRKSGKWSFPKGHRNTSESPLACARREAYEETGLQVQGPYQSLKLHIGNYYLVENFQEQAPNPQDTAEILQARWFTIEEMRARLVNVDVSFFLRDVAEQYERPQTPSNPYFNDDRV